MDCHFQVGQKVVLAVPYGETAQFEAFLNGDTLPVPNVVYTIKEIEWVAADEIVFIRLNEISNPIPDHMEREAAFNAARFRPIVERGTETGMSILRDLLNKQSQTVREDA